MVACQPSFPPGLLSVKQFPFMSNDLQAEADGLGR